MSSYDTLLLDALPYTDAGYDEPGAKQTVRLNFFLEIKSNNYLKLIFHIKVMALIEEELRRYKPTKNYLEVFGPINYQAFLVNNQLLKMSFKVNE